MKPTIYLAALASLLATMGLAAPASADYVSTTTGGAAATPTIHLVNEGGHLTIHNPIGNISCSSTIEGAVDSHGGGDGVLASLTTLTFTGCTNGWHVTTATPGYVGVIWTGGHNGLLSSTNARIDTTRFGITCVYETHNTTIGTVTGGNPATVHIDASIPLDESSANSGLCGLGPDEWEGSYVTTSALYVGSS